MTTAQLVRNSFQAVVSQVEFGQVVQVTYAWRNNWHGIALEAQDLQWLEQEELSWQVCESVVVQAKHSESLQALNLQQGQAHHYR